jgi:Bacterial Ig-like domain
MTPGVASGARRLGLTVTLLVPFAAAPAHAQISSGGYNRYEAMYPNPEEVSFDSLVQNPEPYLHKAIRTKARLQIPQGLRGVFQLQEFNARVTIIPVQEIAGEFESEARKFVGGVVEVTGLFDVTNSLTDPYYIQFWKFDGPPEPIDEKKPIESKDVSLEALVTKPGARDGQTVRVVGKFRGNNLYGDLPVSSNHASSDWVIKDDVWSIWITGRKPKGAGWELDPKLKRDTGKWVEVIGKPETKGNITYLKAIRVALSAPPTATADVQPPPPPPERPKLPPVVVFALPLDGEREVPSDSRFTVQFSKDMDEQTFEGHIQLRYAGPKQPGDRDFDGLKLSYDGGRRALTIDPGDVLRPGRQIELILLPGIADVDGLSLEPRPGKNPDGAVDVFRFHIGT